MKNKTALAAVALGYNAARRVKVWERKVTRGRVDVCCGGVKIGMGENVALMIEGRSWGTLDAVWEAWDVG